MTDPMTDLEDRLRAAVHAHTADVVPDGRGSLADIRTRVRTARRRRWAVLAGAAAAVVAAVAVGLPRLGDDGDAVFTGPDRETPTTTSPPTTGPASDTPVPPAALDQALWPDPDGELFADPVDAARSFVEDVIGADDPPLSRYHAGEPGAGEVDVFGRGEDGRPLDRVVGTVVVRQLDGDHWFVTAAGSDDVQIDAPEPLEQVISPVPVSGRGRGYEGTVVVELRARSRPPTLLADAVSIAGSADALAPFAVDLDAGEASGAAILLAKDSPGADLAVPSFGALPLELTGPGSPVASGDTPAPGTAGEGSAFHHQPLWPFASPADVDAWRTRYREQGTQPWHLDPEQTALSFTQAYLGFREIDRVVDVDVRDRDAWVSVGYDPGSGRLATAAVVHLARYGGGDDAPWEVVGTRDTDLTLETPRYGSAVSSPVTAGGHVTGVDESLRVQLRQPSSPAPIGEMCCLPAGGQDMPWETTVAFSGATDPALTIVVSTGGHVQDVERFAITGVHR